MRWSWRKVPQLVESELKDMPLLHAGYQRELSRGLHESLRGVQNAIIDIDAAPKLQVARITDQPFSDNSLVTLHFDSVLYDTHGWWNPVNWSYTPKQPGFYRCAWVVNARDVVVFPTSEYVYTRLDVGTDGAVASYLVREVGNGAWDDLQINGETVVEVDGVTPISLRMFARSGTTQPFIFGGTNPYRTWMTIDYVGERR